MNAYPFRVSLPVTLVVCSPFLFRGLAGRLLGVDATALRDPVTGLPIIPADQIRGVIREAIEDLADAGVTIAGKVLAPAIVEDFFGRKSREEDEDGAANAPERGRLLFSDLVADLPSKPKCTTAFDGEMTRVAINDDTGAADEGKLQIIELPVPFGTRVPFRGTATLFAQDEAEAEHLTLVVDRALGLIGTIGSAKSAGFGEVAEQGTGTGKRTTVRLSLPAPASHDRDRQAYDVTFDRPYLVDSELVADNVVAGSTNIPGGVFKGALAHMLGLAGEDTDSGALGLALEQMVVTTAFPLSRDGAPIGRPLPYSLIAQKAGDTLHFADMLDVDRPPLLRGKAALFPGDWKDGWYEHANRLLNRPTDDGPASDARTHTKIKGDTGIAEESQLFTTISRVHQSAPERPWTFRLNVDLGGINDVEIKAQARRLLAFLEQWGLDGIGKTGAHAHFAPQKMTGLPSPRTMHGTRNRYAVTVETEALMVDALAMIDETTGRWRNGGESASAYKAYWAWALPGCIVHSHFAAETYRGGHIARRRRSFGGANYHPLLLTQPGSVFLIETDTPNDLERLMRLGLPAAPQTGAAQLTWRNCRYLPQNGFGQIAVDYRSQPISFTSVDS